MDVVVVRGVVDGLEEPLELARGPAVHNQNEGDAHRRRMGGVSRVLVPLDIHISLTWMWKKNMSTQKTHPGTTDPPFQWNRIHSGLYVDSCTACWELIFTLVFPHNVLLELNLPPVPVYKNPLTA